MKAFLIAIAVIAALGYLIVKNTYNGIIVADETTKSSWSEVLNQYQRRADLVPNLVKTVEGYAAHEKEVLEQVTAARAKVGEIKVTADTLNDPEALKKFQAAQGQLSSALSRLIAVSENYPQLKADGLFRDLQAQLEGTENRISVARNRFIQAIQDFNSAVRTFPNNLLAGFFGFHPKPAFSVEDENAISKPPEVKFNTSNPAPASPAPSNTPAPANN